MCYGDGIISIAIFVQMVLKKQSLRYCNFHLVFS
jgi:hypothetical protein